MARWWWRVFIRIYNWVDRFFVQTLFCCCRLVILFIVDVGLIILMMMIVLLMLLPTGMTRHSIFGHLSTLRRRSTRMLLLNIIFIPSHLRIIIILWRLLLNIYVHQQRPVIIIIVSFIALYFIDCFYLWLQFLYLFDFL